MTSFVIAIKIKECSSKIKDTCLFRMRHNNKCDKAIFDCPYAMRINPLCMNKNINDCRRNWRVQDYKGEKYIFYDCHKRCEYFLKEFKDFKDTPNLLLESLDSKDIIYGKTLKKMIKEIFKDKKPVSDIERTANFFEDAFKALNTRR